MLQPRQSQTFEYRFPAPSDRHREAIWMHWIVRMRWVAMAAVMLKPRHAAALGGFAVAGYSLLFVAAVPLNLAAHPISAVLLASLGQIVAFVVTATAVGGIVAGMVHSLRIHDSRTHDIRPGTVLQTREA